MSEDTHPQLRATRDKDAEAQLSAAGRETGLFSKTQQELKRNLYAKYEHPLKV